MKLLSAVTRYRELTVFLLMIVFALIVGVVNGSFITVNSLMVILNGAIVLLLMAIGESFVLIVGEIDVSVGSIIGISAAVAGTSLMQGDWNGYFVNPLNWSRVGCDQWVGDQFFENTCHHYDARNNGDYSRDHDYVHRGEVDRGHSEAF